MVLAPLSCAAFGAALPRQPIARHRWRQAVPHIPLLFLLAALCWPKFGAAVPFTPTSDAQVLERLPARAAYPRMRDMAEMRRALAKDPRNAALAVRLVGRYQAELAAEGDPRYIGYAQAALAPWWSDAKAPVDVRVARAVLLQFNHQFAPALEDLLSVVREQPDHAQAWAWITAIAMVQADYNTARRACAQMAQHSPLLIGVACAAQVDGSTGQGARAQLAITAALRSQVDATPEAQLWALTRLAELQERLGQAALAETSYRQALALGVSDGYLQAAYADFLLDQKRPAEVIELLKDKSRSDLLLLRLALAGKLTNDKTLPAWSAALSARFDAAKLRGDTVHQKEEARFALHVLADATRALPLALANFEVQREPADARLVLEAALAAQQRAAAEPALVWLRSSKIESQILQTLATQVEALK